MKKTNLGQLSLEYLLLISILLGVFATFLSAAYGLYNSGLFAVDVKNAKIFSHEVEKKINFLSNLSDGSAMEITASPAEKWGIFYEDETLYVQIKNSNLNQVKTFGFSPALLPLISDRFIEHGERVILEKKGSTVLIKNS